MTNWLVKCFIKNSEDIENESVRLSYGTLSSFVGIACNVLLFIFKFMIGTFANSISIVSDAFNNLSDCLSCIVTLFGYRLAAKPADKEHPFGHGRMEYVVSFVVTGIIFIVAYNLFIESLNKTIHPEPVTFTSTAGMILVASILVKLWMSFFNAKLGKKIDSMIMITTAQDSRNDVLTTLVALGANILGMFYSSIPLDGIGGMIVAIYIFISGFNMAKDIIDELLGKPASKELTDAILDIINSHPEVIGVHDMMIHDYGPGKKMGSCHVEVDASMNFMKAHEVVDNAERKIEEQLHVIMTIHLDPVDLHDPETEKYKEQVTEILGKMDPSLSIHDFRIVSGDSHTNLVFDVLMPYECTLKEEEIKKQIDKALESVEHPVYTVMHFDREFVDR